MTAARAFAVVLALALASIPTLMIWRFAAPDHVKRLVDQAGNAYRAGNFGEAKSNLEWALISIKGQNLKRYEALLPLPLVE